MMVVNNLDVCLLDQESTGFHSTPGDLILALIQKGMYIDIG